MSTSDNIRIERTYCGDGIRTNYAWWKCTKQRDSDIWLVFFHADWVPRKEWGATSLYELFQFIERDMAEWIERIDNRVKKLTFKLEKEY